MPATSRRAHAPPEERRAQILEAALQCFAERGYHATKMDDLVAASGLSKGSLYWHFRSKQDVFLALFDAFVERFFADWDSALAVDEPTLELLRRVAEVGIENLGSQRPLLQAWAEFFTHPAARERFALIYRRSRAKLVDVFERGIARGELRELPVDSMASTLIGVLEGLYLQAMVDPGFDPRPHWPTAWAIVERGLAR